MRLKTKGVKKKVRVDGELPNIIMDQVPKIEVSISIPPYIR